MSGRIRTRSVTFTGPEASAVADALSYYLLASSGNFGQGWEAGHDDDERAEYEADRRRQERKLARLMAIADALS